MLTMYDAEIINDDGEGNVASSVSGWGVGNVLPIIEFLIRFSIGLR